MAFIIRRTILLFATLALVSIITFSVFRIIPGDPVRTMLGTEADEAQVQAMTHELGLNEPIHIQYIEWVKGAAVGDFGESIRYSRPVFDLILGRLPVTLSLAVMAIMLVMIVSIPLGIWMAKRYNTWIDVAVSSVTQLGMAIPSFWLGMLLILYLGMTTQFFTTSGYVPWGESVTGAFGALLLPALTIALPQIAVNFRYVRNSVLEQMGLDYVRTIRSRGMTEGNVLFKHVLKNAMIPVLTIFGVIFAEVVAGTIIVEQVFALPGIGSLVVDAISYRDFPLVQGIIIYMTTAVVLINFAVDILYSFLDARIRLS